MRLLGGIFGSSPLVIVGGILADVWDSYRRGQAMSMFSATTFLGPTLGKLGRDLTNFRTVYRRLSLNDGI